MAPPGRVASKSVQFLPAHPFQVRQTLQVRRRDVGDEGHVGPDHAGEGPHLAPVVRAQLKDAIIRAAPRRPASFLPRLPGCCSFFRWRRPGMTPLTRWTSSSLVVVLPLLPVMATNAAGVCPLLWDARSSSALFVSSTRMTVPLATGVRPPASSCRRGCRRRSGRTPHR